MLEPIEEIKTRLDLVEVIKGYFPLQLAGANYRARCPFHQEKSGSFMISPSKQIWHCFGCGQGGDLFSFVMKQEGLEFGEALRLLADRAGVQLVERDTRDRGEKNRLLDCIDLAAGYYAQALMRAGQGSIAREYVAKRGLDQGLIDEFKIGYALPDRESLSQFLLSRKFNAQEIIGAGLAMKKNFGYGIIDRFSNRLMIPIRNVHGSVAGFGARVLDPKDEGAKYINSSQGALYDKSKIVFGLDKAKNDIRQKDCAILVEGYMDFFALWAADYKNVVATSGTALTIEQIGLLKRFTRSLLFSFDSDAAGSQATLRGIEMALREGMNVKIIQLPRRADGTPLYKDPDECVKADRIIWDAAVSHARSFVDFYFDTLLTPTTLADAYKKKTVVRQLLSVIHLIPDNLERDHWIKIVGQRVGLSERVLWEELKTLDREKEKKSPSSANIHQAEKPMRVARDEMLLAFIIAYPEHRQIAKDIPSHIFSTAEHRAIFETLASKNAFSDEMLPETTRLELLASSLIDEYGGEGKVKNIISEFAIVLRDEYRRTRIAELGRLMKEAERMGDTNTVQLLLEEYNRLGCA